MMQETKTTLCQVKRRPKEKNDHGSNEIPLRRRALHRVQRLRHRLQERERGALGREPPARRDHQRRRAGRASISVACMHCSDAPCMAVCPVDCFYKTEEGVVLHDKDLCIGCGYCFYACPFGAPQFPQAGAFGARGKMDKCTFCAGGPEKNAPRTSSEVRPQPPRRRQAAAVRRDVLDQGAARRRRATCMADIYRQRVDGDARQGRRRIWGWGTAYGPAPTTPPRADPRPAC
jgi:formate dehydrogenase iron-sulfur subunit